MRLPAARAAAVLLSLAACGGAPAEPDEAPSLRADVLETRAARSQATVSVALTNGSAAPVEVERLVLRSPAFTPVPPTERALTVPAGASSGRFFLPYGAPRCGERVSAVLVVSVRTTDGVREVEAPVTDRSPGLGRLHELACAAERVRGQASVGFGDGWQRVEQDGEQLLRTTVELERRGTQAVAVTRLDGNVVFSLQAAAAGPPVLVLPADERQARVAVDVRASRCDPHALTESKRELLLSFPAFARVGDEPEASMSLRVPTSAEDALLSLMHDVCIAPLTATGASPAP